jgi:hypothetical protein
MALNDITIVDGADTLVYQVISVPTSAGANRLEKSSSLSTPEYLEISHQLGSQTKPDRHLVKLSKTKQDNTDLAHFETGSAHIVFTVPRNLLTLDDIVAEFRRLYIYLEGGTGDYDNLKAILRGSLG